LRSCCRGACATGAFRNGQGAFTLVSANGGLNLYQGNNNHRDAAAGGAIDLGEYPALPELTEAQRDKVYQKWAVAWIKEHPGEFSAARADSHLANVFAAGNRQQRSGARAAVVALLVMRARLFTTRSSPSDWCAVFTIGGLGCCRTC
jgi:hypothetical protein